MMKWLRLSAAIAGVFLLLGLACGAWFIYDFETATGTDMWQRDGPPSSTNMARLLGSGYPNSIHRVVESGASSRFNGDGEELIIFCFATTDLPEMKRLLADGGSWVPGFPDGPNWRDQIESRSPPDLKISPTAPASDFIHVQLHQSSCTIIDTVHGISYRVISRT